MFTWLRFSMALALTLLAATALIAAVQAAETASQSPYAGTLKQHGIAPTRAGLTAYLGKLEPSQEQLAEARRLIAQLGDDNSFARREAAMQQLIAMPRPPMDEIEAATASHDPEVRWRAKGVRDAIRGGERDRVLLAVLKTLEQNQFEGVASDLLRTIPHCSDNYLRQIAIGALVASAQAADAQLLRESLRHENVHCAAAACLALEKALGETSGKDLQPLLASSQAELRLAAAQALINHGDRAAIPALIDLLEAESIELRTKANAILRAATGENVGYAAYAAANERAEKVQQWKTWHKEHGKTANLSFPLKALNRLEMGHSVITAYTQGRAYVIDPSGKEILKFESELAGPWGAEFLPNGNYLINYYNSAAVVEFDPRGKVVWKFHPGNLSNTWSAQRLPNGNTLIATGQLAIEVDADGKRVWEKAFEAQLCHALRLENGNTLVGTIGTPGRVVEIDPSGKEVLVIKDTQMAYRLQRLENGNTLLTEKSGGRVREFDSRGEMVWEHKIANPDGAQRLANGNTLIGNSLGLHEVTPQGESVWRHEVTGQTQFIRY